MNTADTESIFKEVTASGRVIPKNKFKSSFENKNIINNAGKTIEMFKIVAFLKYEISFDFEILGISTIAIADANRKRSLESNDAYP